MTCIMSVISKLSFCCDGLFVCEDAKARIIDIMNATLSLPRADLKQNRPIVEKLEVPAVKRSRFVGLGGLNLKKVMAETGGVVFTCQHYQCLSLDQPADLTCIVYYYYYLTRSLYSSDCQIWSTECIVDIHWCRCIAVLYCCWTSADLISLPSLTLRADDSCTWSINNGRLM